MKPDQSITDYRYECLLQSIRRNDEWSCD